MKSYKQLLILFFLFSIPVFAQHEEKSEKIKAFKISFITTELDLTPDESVKFWPIYNAFDDKQFELRHQRMKSFKSKFSDENLSKMTDKEAYILLSQIESNEDELYQIRKKFMSSLNSILTPIKIIKLKKAEIDFNRKLLQQYKNKGQN
jgi:hypothetical protein